MKEEEGGGRDSLREGGRQTDTGTENLEWSVLYLLRLIQVTTTFNMLEMLSFLLGAGVQIGKSYNWIYKLIKKKVSKWIYNFIN